MWKVVGTSRDKELKMEDGEVTHTLRGVGEGLWSSGPVVDWPVLDLGGYGPTTDLSHTDTSRRIPDARAQSLQEWSSSFKEYLHIVEIDRYTVDTRDLVFHGNRCTGSKGICSDWGAKLMWDRKIIDTENTNTIPEVFDSYLYSHDHVVTRGFTTRTRDHQKEWPLFQTKFIFLERANDLDLILFVFHLISLLRPWPWLIYTFLNLIRLLSEDSENLRYETEGPSKVVMTGMVCTDVNGWVRDLPSIAIDTGTSRSWVLCVWAPTDTQTEACA